MSNNELAESKAKLSVSKSGLALEVTEKGEGFRTRWQARKLANRSVGAELIRTVGASAIEKISSGHIAGLTELEMLVLAEAYPPLVRSLRRKTKMIERVAEVLPDVEALMGRHQLGEGVTSERFEARLEGDVGDVDGEVRDIYARLIAGEIVRPGTFSLKTLDVLRNLEASTLHKFDSMLRFLVAGKYLPARGMAVFEREGYSVYDMVELDEAGLVSRSGLGGATIEPDDSGRVCIPHHDRVLIVRQATAIGLVNLERLTRAGRELAMLSGHVANDEFFRELGAAVRRSVQGQGRFKDSVRGMPPEHRVQEVDELFTWAALDGAGQVTEEQQFAPLLDIIV